MAENIQIGRPAGAPPILEGLETLLRRVVRSLAAISLPLTKMLPLKKVFYGSLRMSGAFRIARCLNRHKALILTYHGVVRSASDVYLHRICIDADIFEEQMEWLKRNYSVLSLSRLLDGLEGKSSLPPFSVAITFDDGFKNNYSVAYPILKRYELPATIFLATSYIGEHGKLWTDHVDSLVLCSTKDFLHLPRNGRLAKFNVSSRSLRTRTAQEIRSFLKTLSPDDRDLCIKFLEEQVDLRDERFLEMEERYAFMTWDEVRTMAENQIEFGSHTHSHPILTTIGDEDLEAELTLSKEIIEQQLVRSCDLFSYPNGTVRDFALREELALKRRGFRAASTQVWGFNRPGENAYQLKRINVSRSNNLSYFKALLSGMAGMV